MTETKRRSILKYLQNFKVTGQEVNLKTLDALSAQHGVKRQEIIEICQSAQIRYQPPPTKPEPPAPIAPEPKQSIATPELSVHAKRAIARGIIYKRVPTGDADAPIVTTYRQFLKERAAIRKWIEDLGGEWPT